MQYHKQIKHPLWQKKRLEVLQRRDFKCQSCGADSNELHVHHPFYKRGAMIWDYEVEELQCLCQHCHKDAHLIDERIKKLMGRLAPAGKEFILGVATGMLGEVDSLGFSAEHDIGWEFGYQTVYKESHHE